MTEFRKSISLKHIVKYVECNSKVHVLGIHCHEGMRNDDWKGVEAALDERDMELVTCK